MALLAVPARYNAFSLELTLPEAGLQPRHNTTLTLTVRDAQTNVVVRQLQEVHTKLFHLFMVSDDLEFFAHLHPAIGRDGRLRVSLSVPNEGLYRIFADFFPVGGSPQFVQRLVPTAGYRGHFGPVAPPLNPDVGVTNVSGTSVALTMQSREPGREQLITFELHDQRTGAPVRDLEPYLGAWGHLLVVAADRSSGFHSHPVDQVSTPGGPMIVFQLMFPRAGTYRLWAQFQRGGQTLTVPFTVDVDGLRRIVRPSPENQR
jgi:hypothetical protein